MFHPDGTLVIVVPVPPRNVQTKMRTSPVETAPCERPLPHPLLVCWMPPCNWRVIVAVALLTYRSACAVPALIVCPAENSSEKYMHVLRERVQVVPAPAGV